MTWYTSDIKRVSMKYFLSAAIALVFALIYEYFSHGVYSMSMLLAFLYPFIGGIIYIFLAVNLDSVRKAFRIASNLFMAGIATLTVGGLFTGVLEIYGTTNKLMIVYKLLGSISLSFGIVLFLLCRLAYKRREENKNTPIAN